MLPAPIWAEMNKDNIKLVTGLSKPPYVNQRDDSGLQLDLIREAFLTEGIETNFTYMPQSRNITGYKKWSVDGVITVPVNFQYEGMYLSKPYIRYQNVAISLAQRNFVLNRVRDLSGKSIVAFQNARKYLGQDYAKVVAYSLDYREVAEQRKQVDMLFAGDTEVIVMDVNIFKHFFSIWQQYNDPNDIIIHKIFYYIFCFIIINYPFQFIDVNVRNRGRVACFFGYIHNTKHTN